MNDIDICFPGSFIAVLKLDFFKKKIENSL